MNLFAECLRRFSQLELESLVDQIEPNMPAHFLVSTLRLNKNLEKHEKEIQETVAWLANPQCNSKPWRNPEVFGQIALLATQPGLNGNHSKTIDALRVHSGLIDPEVSELQDGIWRLAHLNGKIYRVDGREKRDISDLVVTTVENFPGLVFVPFPGLFSDLVDSNLYPSASDDFDRNQLLSTLHEALDLLANYSSELVCDLKRVIQTIVLVPNIGDQERWSYNLRLAYFGAIFINPFVVGCAGIAEALIHEYYHQRFWQWWAYDPPDGLPAEDQLITSPVTQRPKPARVMLQAFVIYTAVHAFYETQLANHWARDHQTSKWIGDRTELLARAIVQLHERLREVVPEDTRARAMLDHVRQCSKPLVSA